MISTSLLYRLLLGGIIFVYSVFGLHHLQSFVTADEHYWVSERIPRYWEALAEQKWTRTFINDKPGVSVALVSGISTLLYPESEDHCPERDDRTLNCDTEVTQAMYQAFRLPLLITNGLLLVVLFFLIRRLWGDRIAFFTTLFSAWSPILLGISQIVNPDTLLWSFGAVAIFSYFSLLLFEEKKYFFLTLFALTFAVLSKYVALVLLPFFLAVAVFRFLAEEESSKAHTLLKKDILSWLLLIFGTGALICVFVPALVFDSKYITEFIQTVPDRERFALVGGILFSLLFLDTFLLKNILLGKLRALLIPLQKYLHFSLAFFLVLFGGLIIARNFFPDWSLFTRIAFDLKDLSDARYYTTIPNFFESFLLEWNPVVFSLTPIVLLSFFWLFITFFKKKFPAHAFLVYAVFFFFVVYTVLLIFSNVLSTPRYSILLYPLFSFLAALGVAAFIDQYGASMVRKNIIIALVVFASLTSLIASSPFYFNYTNVLLPKNAMIQDAWGYGGYEAAEYLNSLPDAANLTVWADYYGVCEFFVGRCLTAYTFDKETVRPDYYVLTRRGQARYMSRSSRWERLSGLLAYRYYHTPSPEWQLFIGGRPGNFVKVVKVDYSFRSSIITDIDHCPSREAVSEEHLQSFLSFSQEKDVDFLISLGDNASHRLRNCSETGDEDARYIATRLRASGRPTHFVLGDHDIASDTKSYQNWIKTTERETTYYSFDNKDVHVVILDTVLGGEAMRESCPQDPQCSALEQRLKDMSTLSWKEYTERYQATEKNKWLEHTTLTRTLEKTKNEIDQTRSFGIRDRGQILAPQLEWLKQDLAQTSLQKVVVFSDHPLFPFISEKKSYDIAQGDQVRSILEKSGKEIVAISGEAHLWHEEKRNGISYYIVNEFRQDNGSFAYFVWDDSGFRFEKISH